MKRSHFFILGGFYILGLGLTSVLGFPTFTASLQQWLLVVSIVLICSSSFYFILPRLPLIGVRRIPRLKLALMGGIIALIAVAYFQFRVPQPNAQDLQQVLVQHQVSHQFVTVTGTITEEPKLNSKGKVRFILAPQTVILSSSQNLPQPVTGKVYVTLPILQGTGLFHGQKITINGLLYLPQSTSNPGGFDFQYYLAQRGIFTGLSGVSSEINVNEKPPQFSFAPFRNRIIKAQVKALDSPAGELVSSIVLGRRAVDLPYSIRDLFMNCGLAHILAASGFHVSLLLGVSLRLTESLSSRQKLIIGFTVLIFYVILTGASPSVCRATIMGGAGLIGLATERKTNPIASLAVAAVFLLIINPLWFWNLGFQMSFLATLGLILTAPTIEKKLDFIFPVIAAPLAVSLSATLWLLPLMLYTFNSLALYSIIVNIITTPLVIVISLGGMISSFVALFIPLIGSFLASSLYYPTHLLINIVAWFSDLPYSKVAVGQIPLGMMLLIYGLFSLLFFQKKLQKYWYLLGGFIIALIIIPLLYQQFNLVQVTILDSREPNVILQNKGEVTIITSESKDSVNYNLLPFLSAEAINQVDHLFSLNPEDNLSQKIKVKHKEIINVFRPLQLEFKQKKWLFFLRSNQLSEKQTSVHTLTWWGNYITPSLLETIQPEVAIAIADQIDPDVQSYLVKSGIPLYWSEEEGAIQWQEKTGFYGTLER